MNLHALLAVITLALVPLHPARSCCALGRQGEPVVNADQTVLIVWDPATKTEHFIRKASFKAEGNDFGFLVPTPTRPQLSESGNAAFPYLAGITRPIQQSSGGFGCAAKAPVARSAKPAVTVLERKEVAGFDAAVLSANSPTALTGWLKTNGFHFSPEVEAWAAPYIRDGWMLTALRVARQKKSASDVEAAALRISFRTERPLFPYREPDSRSAARELGANSRLLRLYFLSDARYEGKLEGTNGWSGRPVWSGALNAVQKAELLETLKLPPASGPANWWLTEFEDRWPYGVAPGDLYFSRAKSQEPILRWAAAPATGNGELACLLGIPLGIFLLRKKRPLPAGKACPRPC
jgi:hypothetical protein